MTSLLNNPTHSPVQLLAYFSVFYFGYWFFYYWFNQWPLQARTDFAFTSSQ